MKKSGRWEEIGKVLRKALFLIDTDSTDSPTEEVERAMALWRLHNLLWEAIGWENWLLDIYFDTGGAMFALVADNDANLFRVGFEIVNDQVVVGEWVRVTEEFVPVQQAAKTPRLRISEVNGRKRYCAIAATSVLNRVGEIDSRALFDDIVRQFHEGTHDAPYLTFYHEGEQLRLGSIDVVARFGHVLFISGELDDHAFALACADAVDRDAESDPWGISIGFMPTAQPELLRLADDIEIPVYTSGYLVEASLLRERHAASWFTVARNKGVLRAVSEISKEELEKVLKGRVSDEELEAWTARINATERHIRDKGLIARDVPAETETTGAEAVSAEVEVELDEATLGDIAGAVVGNKGFQALLTEAVSKAVSDTLAPVQQAIQALRQRVDEARQDVDALLEVEAEREAEMDADRGDAARRRIHLKRGGSGRPRDRHARVDSDELPEAEDLDAIADEFFETRIR